MMLYYSYPVLLLVDTIQAIYLHSFLMISPLPYMWFKVNSIFGYFHFTFLPKLYSTDTPEQPYSLFITDSTFLGNCSPFFFFIFIFVGVFLLVWGLLRILPKCASCSNPHSACPSLHAKLKSIYKGRLKYSVIFEAFYYPLSITIFFALYQFRGYNQEVPSSGSNIALSVMCLLAYAAFFGWILYISSKLRYKFPGSAPSKTKGDIDKNAAAKIPKKYSFLAMEPSYFPMEVAIRMLIKLCTCIALQIDNPSAQLILLMTLNFVFLTYILIFKPSMYKLTNRLNIFLTLSFIAL